MSLVLEINIHVSFVEQFLVISFKVPVTVKILQTPCFERRKQHFTITFSHIIFDYQPVLTICCYFYSVATFFLIMPL
jgi:hypothetical protein